MVGALGQFPWRPEIHLCVPPSIHSDLGGNVGTLQWTVNAYVMAFGAGVAALIWGLVQAAQVGWGSPGILFALILGGVLIGAVFVIAIVTAVFNSRDSLASPSAVTSGYRPALAVSAAFSVLAATAAFGIRRTPHARTRRAPV
ncbi:MAG: hypothetical protein ACM3ML_32690 [Micromonosporaceae bacterium]